MHRSVVVANALYKSKSGREDLVVEVSTCVSWTVCLYPINELLQIRSLLHSNFSLQKICSRSAMEIQQLQPIQHDKTEKSLQDCSKIMQTPKSLHFELAGNLSCNFNSCCFKFIANERQTNRNFSSVMTKLLQILCKLVEHFA